MEQAYGAGKAGGAFDPITFIRQPQTVLRIVSWIFSIVIFGCIANEGYVNEPSEKDEFCIFNRNQNACNYGVAMGSLAFLCCAAFLALDVYFPQISGVKDRKKAVLLDIGVSAFWSFMWFVGFCFLANQWQVSKPEYNPLNEGADAARAAITFSFFSIFTWGALTLLAFERLKRVSFEEEYNKLFTPQTPPPPKELIVEPVPIPIYGLNINGNKNEFDNGLPGQARCNRDIYTKAGQAFLAFQRYKLGSSSTLFSSDYADPSQDAAVAPPGGTEYTGYTGNMEAPDNMDASYDASTGYQSQPY